MAVLKTKEELKALVEVELYRLAFEYDDPDKIYKAIERVRGYVTELVEANGVKE